MIDSYITLTVTPLTSYTFTLRLANSKCLHTDTIIVIPLTGDRSRKREIIEVYGEKHRNTDWDTVFLLRAATQEDMSISGRGLFRFWQQKRKVVCYKKQSASTQMQIKDKTMQNLPEWTGLLRHFFQHLLRRLQPTCNFGCSSQHRYYGTLCTHRLCSVWSLFHVKKDGEIRN